MSTFGQNQNEIQGWWAALRENDHTVGWIPSAYVQPISEATAEHLRTDKYDVRVQETREKPYYTSNALLDDYVPSPADAMREFDWMPLDGAKVCFESSLLPNSGIAVTVPSDEQFLPSCSLRQGSRKGMASAPVATCTCSPQMRPRRCIVP